MIHVRERLIAWFLANPEEHLTSADVAARWNVDRQFAREIMVGMVSAGLLHAGTEDHRPWQHSSKPRYYWPSQTLLTLAAAA